VDLTNFGSESDTCVGSRVRLVGVSISFEKNFYQLPFTPPSLVRRIGPSDDDPIGMHPICCAACRHSISELYASVDECFQTMEAMRQHMEDFERVVEDDYKFLNRNMRKLFGTMGNRKGKWCNS
jgi:hypothetical protein